MEGEQHVAVPGQFADWLVVFHAIDGDEEVKSGLSIRPRLGLPNIVQMAFCFGLYRFGHRVQHIACFVEPAALFIGRAITLAQGIPKPQSAVAVCQIRRMGKTAPLQIKQQFAPNLGTFTVNHRWSLDFVSDSLSCGRRFRILNEIDDFSRECWLLWLPHRFQATVDMTPIGSEKR